MMEMHMVSSSLISTKEIKLRSLLLQQKEGPSLPTNTIREAKSISRINSV